MANKKSSRWRKRAREVIRHVLERMASDATGEEKRAAISAAYPFGPRKFHPYRMWLLQVSEALRSPAPPPLQPEVAVTGQGVSCGWCNFPHSLGCPFCLEARKRYEQSRSNQENQCAT
jgi:hypothetical protein